MELTTEAIKAVDSSLAGWRRASRGRCPAGTTWEDIQQDAYVAILEASAHDPALGTLGARVNAIVRRVFVDACRDRPREYTNAGVDAPTIPDESYWAVDAEDFLDALSPEDRAVVDRVRLKGLSPRSSAARRKESRVLERIRGGL